MSIMIFSSLLSSVFAWGDESREREGRREKERKEKKKKKKKKEEAKRSCREEQYSAQMDTNEVIGPGRSITACLLDFFPPPLSTFLAPSLRLSLLSSLGGSWRKEEGSRGSK